MTNFTNQNSTTILINTDTDGVQKNPKVTALTNGDVLVVWESLEHSKNKLFAQIFDNNGNKVGAEFKIKNSFMGNVDQHNHNVIALEDGGFFITWETKNSSDRNIYAQVFDENYRLGLTFKVNKHLIDRQLDPKIKTLENGNFVVLWDTDYTYSSGTGLISITREGIYGQLFNSKGSKIGSQFKVDPSSAEFGSRYNNFFSSPSIEDGYSVDTMQDGGFVVSWNTIQNDTSEIYAQIFDENGSKVGAEFRVSSDDEFSQMLPITKQLSEDKFIILWEKHPDYNKKTFHAQIFDENGNKIGNEFIVNPTDQADPENAEIALLDNGNFIVTWESHKHSVNATDIYAQIFDIDGNKVGDLFTINQNLYANQKEASIITLENGNFFVTWEETPSPENTNPYMAPPISTSPTPPETNIFGRLFDANGNPIGTDILIIDSKSLNHISTRNPSNPPSINDSYYYNISISELSDGNLFVSWQGNGNEDSEGIYGTVVSLSKSAPSDIKLDKKTVNPNESGYIVGTLSTIDADNLSHDYKVNDERFEIVSGQLKLKDSTSITDAIGEIIPIEITSTDADNLSYKKSFNIVVNNAPVANDDFMIPFSEGLLIFRQSVNVISNDTDPDGDNLSILSIDNSKTLGRAWVNESSTTSISYVSYGAFDYLSKGESANDEVFYKVSDGKGGIDTGKLTILITGSNQGPTDITITKLSSNQVQAGELAKLSAVDIDKNDTHSFSVSDNRFEVDQNILKTNTNIDFQNEPEIIFDITTKDNHNAFFSKTIAVDENGIMDILTKDDHFSVSEDLQGSFPFSSRKIPFADKGEGVFDVLKNDIFSLGNPKIDSIDNSSLLGQMKIVKIASLTNPNDKSSQYQLKYLPSRKFEHLAKGETATEMVKYNASNGTSTTEGNLTITIIGENDAPTDITFKNQRAIKENDKGALIVDIEVEDVDINDSHTYDIDDNRFETAGNQLKLKDNISIDFEKEETVTLNITATDEEGESTSKNLVVSISDLYDGAVIDGTDDNDSFSGKDKDDKISGNDGNDFIIGKEGNDTLNGNADNDILLGNAGTDILIGGSGNDYLRGGKDADTIDGGEGFDTADYFWETNEAIEVDLSKGKGLKGHAKGDTLISIEKIYGTKFNDSIIGSNQNDQLQGMAGDDFIMSKSGNDFLIGGNGHDVLLGNSNTDTLLGGADNDYLRGGADGDFIDGGEGFDAADYFWETNEAIEVDLSIGKGLKGHAKGDTLINIEKIYGTKFNDTIAGSNQNDQLQGMTGDDKIQGNAGSDTLIGGSGNDEFIYENISDSTNNNFDIIKDFRNGDQINLLGLANEGIDEFSDLNIIKDIQKNETLITAQGINQDEFKIKLNGSFDLDQNDFMI